LFWRSNGAWFLPVPHDEPASAIPWESLEPVQPAPYDAEGSASEADYAFVDEYVEALDEGRPHSCNGDEGRHVMEIMMGIFESAAQGLAIDLPQTERQHPLLKWRQQHGLTEPGPMPRPYNEWLAAEDSRLGRS
ncbi:MAG: hypothetical protein HOE86_00460, partial [Gemmatimonadetes bacterium]|nr:hypothetical protein [Gemmatimonadota bacterium]